MRKAQASGAARMLARVRQDKERGVLSFFEPPDDATRARVHDRSISSAAACQR